jgi:hypothetical protein
MLEAKREGLSGALESKSEEQKSWMNQNYRLRRPKQKAICFSYFGEEEESDE